MSGFRRLTYYAEADASRVVGKPTDKTFLINLDNVETVTEYVDHCKIRMVSGLTFCVCEREDQIIQMA